MNDPHVLPELIGNAAFYRHSHVSRSFLRRNITSILDQHQRELSQTTTDVAEEGAMIANERTLVGWDFPTPDMMQDLFLKGHKPVLTIESFLLRRHGSSQKAAKQLLRDKGDDTFRVKLPCQVTVTVEGMQSGKPLEVYKDRSKTAEIHVREHPKEGLVYQLRLGSPFSIEVDKLHVEVESAGAHGKRHWKRTITKTYSIEVDIQCQDSEDTAYLLGQLENKPVQSYIDESPSEGVLRARCDNILEESPSGRLLPLSRKKGRGTLALQYGLEIAMGWNKQPQGSVLARHNKLLRSRNEAGAQQLLTPNGSDEAGFRVRIEYIYCKHRQTRVQKAYSLKCIFCKRDKEHSTFSRLHLHYLIHHEQFKFAIEEDSRPSPSAPPRKIWISCEDMQTSAEEDRQEVRKEIDWKAPNRPLDVTAYVRGDDNWASGNSPAPAQVPGKRCRPKKQTAAEPMPPMKTLRDVRRPRSLAPWDVPPLPEPLRKKHSLPEVPHVVFYNTASKQRVHDGSDISDPDDSLGKAWLMQRQRRDLAKMGLNGVEREFLEAFNRHLEREQPTSDTMVSDAVVRFTRKYAKRCKDDPRWEQAFSYKLNQLRTSRIINDDIYTYCLSLEVSDGGEDQSKPEVRYGDFTMAKNAEASKQARGTKRPRSATTSDNGGRARKEPKLTSTMAAMEIRPIPHKGQTLSVDREIICCRPSDARQVKTIKISELLDDDFARPDARPTDLDYAEFISILDNELLYIRDADTVACVRNGTTHLISSEKNWHEALANILREGILGPIRFELLSLDEVSKRFESSPADSVAGARDDYGGKTSGRKGLSVRSSSPKRSRPRFLGKGREVEYKKTALPCVCGKMVSGYRGTIACANPYCDRHVHMACVRADRKRDLEWRCIDCSS